MNSESTRRPRVLVTGGGGNFASRIADGLSADFDLVLTDAPGVAAEHAGMIPADLLDYDAVQRAMAGIDMVVHLAITSYYRFKNARGQAYDDEQMRVNLIGTQHVFAAASLAGIRRFVYASSMTIDIGTLALWPVDRDNPPRPTNLYGCTKLFGEQLGEMYARQSGMSVISLRFGQPFPLGIHSDPARLTLPQPRGLLVAFADIEQAVRCALAWPGIGYKMVRIVSASTPANVDLTAAAEIGYRPCRRFTETAEEPVAAKPPRSCERVDKEFRVAAIITTYFPSSHADVIVSRWLEPRDGDADWGWPRPQSRIVAAYIDQIGKDDMGCEILERHEVPLCSSVEQALIEDGELRVDAVLLIGEHGEYGKNELGQLLYPRKEMFDQIVAVYRRVDRCLPIFCDKFLSWNFEWAVDMMRTAFEMNFLLFGGSSVPLCRLSTPFRLAQDVENSKLEVVVVFYGHDEAYGYHSLEFIQPLIDNRPGGESGVHTMT
ncbi:MAG: NAD(P)-dependent oxidoreductase, partial [Lentisphaeria bacterium]|nr:NAD(P)-dependent oxidoreductase [Lentisphaeria bacterium]